MPNPTPAPASQPSQPSNSALSADNKVAISAKPVDPKTQVKAVAESIKTGETTKVEPRKFKVKVDNQEREVDEKELVDNYQLRQLSDKKRSEAEKQMAEYAKLFDHLKKDPIKFLKATGIDFDNLSTSYIAKKAEEAMQDPKERELKAAKAEAEQYKKWVEEQKAAQEKAQREAAVNQSREQLHKEIIEALEERKDMGLPIDEHLIIQIAQDLMVQDKAQKPLSAKEALPKTYARTQKWLQGLASKMEGEALVKWLGEDTAMKIRKYDLAQLKAKRAATTAQPQAAVKPQEQRKEQAAPQYKTWSQFKRDTLDKIQ